MANRYYGVDIGGGMPTDVTESGSTTSKPVELVVDVSATGVNKMQVLKAIEALEYYITTDTWPPA